MLGKHQSFHLHDAGAPLAIRLLGDCCMKLNGSDRNFARGILVVGVAALFSLFTIPGQLPRASLRVLKPVMQQKLLRPAKIAMQFLLPTWSRARSKFYP